jgi:hypothetical protein
MKVVRKQRVTLYVDRSSQQWVVVDSEGNFWMLPNVANPWDHRQLIFPTKESELEPVPGHYQHLLGLPTN